MSASGCGISSMKDAKGGSARRPTIPASGSSHTTGQVTHHIAPDIDAERDRLVAELQQAGVVQSVQWKDGFHTELEGHNGGGDPWRTDGRLAIVSLRSDEGWTLRGIRPYTRLRSGLFIPRGSPPRARRQMDPRQPGRLSQGADRSRYRSPASDLESNSEPGRATAYDDSEIAGGASRAATTPRRRSARPRPRRTKLPPSA